VASTTWALPRPGQDGQGSATGNRRAVPRSTQGNKKGPLVLRGTGQRMLPGALAEMAVKPAPLKT